MASASATAVTYVSRATARAKGPKCQGTVILLGVSWIEQDGLNGVLRNPTLELAPDITSTAPFNGRLSNTVL